MQLETCSTNMNPSPTINCLEDIECLALPHGNIFLLADAVEQEFGTSTQDNSDL